ncbi:GntR family transcriptional regulator [Nonomuraea typhae]|uniref:GntR family transcriptional regulator n=1 Tax=Nonomuraea typhae TaxID=2603600 RepID=A0ABW7ZAX8_9ACTN
MAEAIRADIGEGRLKPHLPLPSETHLTQEFGISRSSARRAVADLVSLGLVHTVHGKGSFVRARHVVTVELEPEMRITARLATDGERQTMEMSEGSPVIVIEDAAGMRRCSRPTLRTCEPSRASARLPTSTRTLECWTFRTLGGIKVGIGGPVRSGTGDFGHRDCPGSPVIPQPHHRGLAVGLTASAVRGSPLPAERRGSRIAWDRLRNVTVISQDGPYRRTPRNLLPAANIAIPASVKRPLSRELFQHRISVHR